MERGPRWSYGLGRGALVQALDSLLAVGGEQFPTGGGPRGRWIGYIALRPC